MDSTPHHPHAPSTDRVDRWREGARERAPRPKNGKWLVAVLVGGPGDVAREFGAKCALHGVEVRYHWPTDKRLPTQIPVDVDAVVLLREFAPEAVTKAIALAAEKAGVVAIRTQRKWAAAWIALRDRLNVAEAPPIPGARPGTHGKVSGPAPRGREKALATLGDALQRHEDERVKEAAAKEARRAPGAMPAGFKPAVPAPSFEGPGAPPPTPPSPPAPEPKRVDAAPPGDLTPPKRRTASEDNPLARKLDEARAALPEHLAKPAPSGGYMEDREVREPGVNGPVFRPLRSAAPEHPAMKEARELRESIAKQEREAQAEASSVRRSSALDPDVMHGAGDGFGGEDYPSKEDETERARRQAFYQGAKADPAPLFRKEEPAASPFAARTLRAWLMQQLLAVQGALGPDDEVTISVTQDDLNCLWGKKGQRR